ncbi:MmcQ/YjbR family DNA-binding protein [Actinomycetospora sp. CA-084318]|uniref:MmcQ/YjbR family DNA-binding protein n=1 Tax=Actinomycetospora sp. CA-084318 TaxID=3239892 RepID=UPI003D95AEFA
MGERPDVPEEFVERIDAVLRAWQGVTREPAWVGTRWKVRGATVAHVFGGEDGLFRITFRGEPDEVAAFGHMGPPYFTVSWGSNVIGLLLDEDSDWEELAELLQDSYRIQAPAAWAT